MVEHVRMAYFYFYTTPVIKIPGFLSSCCLDLVLESASALGGEERTTGTQVHKQLTQETPEWDLAS
jgi:hypothetical protein